MKKEMICILCPRGCRLSVDTDTLEVLGHSCPRGTQFGPQELTNAKRMLTTTATIVGAIHKRIPVRTTSSVPLDKIFECMKEIKKLKLIAPIRRGDILIENILDIGVDIIASRSL